VIVRQYQTIFTSLRNFGHRHMFAQLCVYGGALAQAHATITGITYLPTYQIRYYEQDGKVVAAGTSNGDCMCLDYCVSAFILLALFDIAFDIV
jgi:hypothetical protein